MGEHGPCAVGKALMGPAADAEAGLTTVSSRVIEEAQASAFQTSFKLTAHAPMPLQLTTSERLVARLERD